MAFSLATGLKSSLIKQIVKTAAKNRKLPTSKKTVRMPNNSAIKPPIKGPVRVPATTPVDKVPKAEPDFSLGT